MNNDYITKVGILRFNAHDSSVYMEDENGDMHLVNMSEGQKRQVPYNRKVALTVLSGEADAREFTVPQIPVFFAKIEDKANE